MTRFKPYVIAGRPIMPTERDYASKDYLRQGALGAPTIRLRWVLLAVAFVWAVML